MNKRMNKLLALFLSLNAIFSFQKEVLANKEKIFQPSSVKSNEKRILEKLKRLKMPGIILLTFFGNKKLSEYYKNLIFGLESNKSMLIQKNKVALDKLKSEHSEDINFLSKLDDQTEQAEKKIKEIEKSIVDEEEESVRTIEDLRIQIQKQDGIIDGLELEKMERKKEKDLINVDISNLNEKRKKIKEECDKEIKELEDKHRAKVQEHLKSIEIIKKECDEKIKSLGYNEKISENIDLIKNESEKCKILKEKIESYLDLVKEKDLYILNLKSKLNEFLYIQKEEDYKKFLEDLKILKDKEIEDLNRKMQDFEKNFDDAYNKIVDTDKLVEKKKNIIERNKEKIKNKYDEYDKKSKELSIKSSELTEKCEELKNMLFRLPEYNMMSFNDYFTIPELENDISILEDSLGKIKSENENFGHFVENAVSVIFSYLNDLINNIKGRKYFLSQKEKVLKILEIDGKKGHSITSKISSRISNFRYYILCKDEKALNLYLFMIDLLKGYISSGYISSNDINKCYDSKRLITIIKSFSLPQKGKDDEHDEYNVDNFSKILDLVKDHLLRHYSTVRYEKSKLGQIKKLAKSKKVKEISRNDVKKKNVKKIIRNNVKEKKVTTDKIRKNQNKKQIIRNYKK